MVGASAGGTERAQSDRGVLPAPALGRRRLGGVGLAQGAAILILLAVGHAPLLVKFFQDLNTRPQYDFYPLVMLAAVWLGWDRVREMRDDGVRVLPGSWRFALALLGLSFAILAAGAALRVRWVAPISAWLTLAGVVWRVGGSALARALWPAGLMLLVIIPPPMHLDQVLAANLRTLAVGASSRALDVLGVPHYVSGNVIEIPGQRLLIEEACTGLNSLMAVVAFSLLYGLWARRAVGTIALLLLASAATVVIANVARITVGAWLQATHGVNLLTGSAHELVGLGLFAVCLCVVTGVDALLARSSGRRRAARRLQTGSRGDVAPREGIDRTAATIVPTSTPSASAVPVWAVPAPAVPPPARTPGASWAWWPVAIGFAVLGLCVHVQLGSHWQTPRLRDDATFAMPARVAGWELQADSDRFVERPALLGSRSHVWTYRLGDVAAVVGLDYPFHGYHDLTDCYTATGWSVIQREDTRGIEAGSESRFTSILIRNERGIDAVVLFGTVDESGRWHGPSTRPARGTSLIDRLRRAQDLAEEVPTYQLQTLVVSPAPLTEEQRKKLQALFLAAQVELSRQVLGQLKD